MSLTLRDCGLGRCQAGLPPGTAHRPALAGAELVRGVFEPAQCRLRPLHPVQRGVHGHQTGQDVVCLCRTAGDFQLLFANLDSPRDQSPVAIILPQALVDRKRVSTRRTDQADRLFEQLAFLFGIAGFARLFCLEENLSHPFRRGVCRVRVLRLSGK